MSMIRVLIADDHKMVREGLRRILEFDGEIQVIDEADNGEECIRKSAPVNRILFYWILICRL